MPIPVLQNREISGLAEFRVALPVPMVLAQPQDVRRGPDAVSLPPLDLLSMQLAASTSGL